MDILILFYYAAALAGMLMGGSKIVSYGCRAAPVAAPVQWLLSLGLCAVCISWLGFSGVFRMAGFAPGAGAAFAMYALWEWRLLYRLLREAYRDDPYVFWFIALMAACASVPRWCYLHGGINNGDELRSITLTVSFAANYLKPAFPFNFSIPISYSYYLYQIPAFLYASLSGYRWPSPAVAITGVMAIIMFYAIFALYIRAAFADRGKYTVVIALLCVTFFGLDIFVFTDMRDAWIYPELFKPPRPAMNLSVDHWNGMQVTSMAAYHHWVYQYLLSLAYALAALYALGQYWYQGHRQWLYTGIACTGFCLTFGAITGVWLCAAMALYAAVGFCFLPQRIVPALRCVPVGTIMLLAIMLPQFFTFIGRDALVEWTAPVAWFTRENIGWQSAKENLLMSGKELGPLLMLGCLMIPFYGWAAVRRKQYFLIAPLCMAIICVAGATFTRAFWNDWFWRGSNLFLIAAAAVGTVWLYERLRRRVRARLLHTLIGLCLIPGAVNYAAETYTRWCACEVPSADIGLINEAVDVHSVFFDRKFSNNDTLLAGRIYFDNDPHNFSKGYRNSDYFLGRWLRMPSVQMPCDRTWFGTPLPGGVMRTISRKAIVSAPCPILRR